MEAGRSQRVPRGTRETCLRWLTAVSGAAAPCPRCAPALRQPCLSPSPGGLAAPQRSGLRNSAEAWNSTEQCDCPWLGVGVCWSQAAEGGPGSGGRGQTPVAADCCEICSLGGCSALLGCVSLESLPLSFSLHTAGRQGSLRPPWRELFFLYSQVGKLRPDEGHSLSTVLWQGPGEASSAAWGGQTRSPPRRQGLPVTPCLFIFFPVLPQTWPAADQTGIYGEGLGGQL